MNSISARRIWATAIAIAGSLLVYPIEGVRSDEVGPQPALVIRGDFRLPVLGGMGTDGLAMGAAVSATHRSGVRAGVGVLGFALIDSGTETASIYAGYEFGRRDGQHQWSWTYPLQLVHRWYNIGYEGGTSTAERGVLVEFALEATRWSEHFGFQVRLSVAWGELYTDTPSEAQADGGIGIGLTWR